MLSPVKQTVGCKICRTHTQSLMDNGGKNVSKKISAIPDINFHPLEGCEDYLTAEQSATLPVSCFVRHPGAMQTVTTEVSYALSIVLGGSC